MHRHKCPYCFTEFKTSEYDDAVEFSCANCGNEFTLGEARRGRPDPVPDIAKVAALIAKLDYQERWLELLGAEMKELRRTITDINLRIERLESRAALAHA